MNEKGEKKNIVFHLFDGFGFWALVKRKFTIGLVNIQRDDKTKKKFFTPPISCTIQNV